MYHGERLNSISHLVGTALSLVGLGALLAVGLRTQDPWVIFSFSVFGVAAVWLYTMSTLYHSTRVPARKAFFKRMDRIAIYLLIAGTYTPFTLVSLRNGNGWYILVVIWLLALVGIYTEFRPPGRLLHRGQLLIYLAMGWLGAIEFVNLKTSIATSGMVWLLAGGISYTVGVIFYLLDDAGKLNHAHGIWHLFVIAGTTCHFVAVINYVR